MTLNTTAGALLAGVFAWSAACHAQDGAPKPAAPEANSPAYLPMPEPVFENFKKPEMGIDPKAWQFIDAADADLVRSRHAKLPRTLSYVQKITVANKPAESKLAQVTQELTVLQDGYIYARTNGGMEPFESQSTSITWLGLLPVYSRSHVALQLGHLTEATATRSLIDMGPIDFKPGALAPGGAFAADYAYRNQIYMRTVGSLLFSSPRLTEKKLPGGLKCKVGERTAASGVYAEFTGNALKVSCVANGLEVTNIETYYLEDYAWFTPAETRHGETTTQWKLMSIAKN